MSLQRRYSLNSLNLTDTKKVEVMCNDMKFNKVYLEKVKNISDETEKKNTLINLVEKYKDYRRKWRSSPQEAINKKLSFDSFLKFQPFPLCVDIELASVCDLACPHCFRQYIASPDKVMDKKLALKIIDQCSDLGVPSMKFNWRGEPLLNRFLPEIVNYAKKKGILETIINTNATLLDKAYAKEIIESGLDIMIYSFDGGTKETYEKNRPGRFKKNSYESIVDNIKNFHALRESTNSRFPKTKIQMVLTKDTYKEQDSFFKTFENIVDDITVKQYSERGGDLEDEDVSSKENSGKQEMYMKDFDGTLFKSKKRLPCEQPFQRLLVTYDGRVSMCCYDWGSMHTIGYVDELAIKINEKHYFEVFEKSKNKIKGFEMMNLEMPKIFNEPKKVVSTIQEIWKGLEINKVRSKHIKNDINGIEICKNCTFKDTYDWEKIS